MESGDEGREVASLLAVLSKPAAHQSGTTDGLDFRNVAFSKAHAGALSDLLLADEERPGGCLEGNNRVFTLKEEPVTS